MHRESLVDLLKNLLVVKNLPANLGKNIDFANKMFLKTIHWNLEEVQHELRGVYDLPRTLERASRESASLCTGGWRFQCV